MTGDADIVIHLARPEANHPRNRRVLNRVSRFDDEASILVDRQDDSTVMGLGELDDFSSRQARNAILAALPETAEISRPKLAERLNGRDDKG